MLGAGIGVTLLGPNVGRSRYTASLATAGAVRFVRCDDAFREDDPLHAALDGADALVLLGHVVPTSLGAAQRFLDEVTLNVEPVTRLLRATAGRPCHVVFASSTAVYGVAPRVPVRESDVACPSTPYAAAKLACEQLIRMVAQMSGGTAGILRYSTVYGPGETVTRAIPSFIRAALEGEMPAVHGDGRDVHDYVHVTDVAEATLAAIQRRSNGVYNIGTGIGTTTGDLARLIFGVIDAKVSAAFGSRETAHARVGIVCDTELARADLGFAARRSLAEAIPEEVGWFRTRLAGMRPSDLRGWAA
jgi:UDP-glucose 4-epimerase